MKTIRFCPADHADDICRKCKFFPANILRNEAAMFVPIQFNNQDRARWILYGGCTHFKRFRGFNKK